MEIIFLEREEWQTLIEQKAIQRQTLLQSPSAQAQQLVNQTLFPTLWKMSDDQSLWNDVFDDDESTYP